MIKVNFVTMLKNTFRAKTKKGKAASLAFPIIIMGAIMAVMFFSYDSAVKIFASIGRAEYIFIQSGITTILFIVIMMALSGSGYIFKTKDYELLGSLPIPKWQVVLSKVSSVFLLGLLYAFITFFPSVALYIAYAHTTFSVTILSLVGFLVMPIIPTCIGLLIGLVFLAIGSRVRHKNILTIVCAVLFLFGYLALITYFDQISEALVSSGVSIIKLARYILPSMSMYITGFVRGSVKDMLLLVAITLVVLGLVLWLVIASYDKINKRLAVSNFAVSKRALQYRQTSVTSALIKKEFRQYFSYPSWVLNTLIGLILSLVVPVILYISKADKTWNSGDMPSNIPFALVLICALTALIVMGNTSSASISSEGKNFYLTKSLPVKVSKIFSAKILFNFILDLPFCLATSTLSAILFRNSLDVVTGVALFAIPIIASISMSFVGLMVNLLYPKIEWQNISEVVKSGLPIFIVNIGGMILNIGLVGASSSLKLEQTAILAIYAGAYLLLLAVSFIVLKVKGEKLFNRI